MEIALLIVVTAAAPIAVGLWNWWFEPPRPPEQPLVNAPPAHAQYGPPSGIQHRAPWPAVERIGIILVHGIGEQRRFEHLDSQLRGLIRACHNLPEIENVTVDIAGSGAAAFQAQQETWSAGPAPSVTIVLKHRANQPAGSPAGAQMQETNLFVHEVWWADVNERYSIAKQLRFWWWPDRLGIPGTPASGRAPRRKPNGSAGRTEPFLGLGPAALMDGRRVLHASRLLGRRHYISAYPPIQPEPVELFTDARQLHLGRKVV